MFIRNQVEQQKLYKGSFPPVEQVVVGGADYTGLHDNMLTSDTDSRRPKGQPEAYTETLLL